ncbi:MAG: N-acetylmuramoyl-L-alanine amidase [Chloroherpetonaceae bacterium]|nr:N-acetylmuramoyl-L-alanine amidase [Chloroherpetonaceae bacterium]
MKNSNFNSVLSKISITLCLLLLFSVAMLKAQPVLTIEGKIGTSKRFSDRVLIASLPEAEKAVSIEELFGALKMRALPLADTIYGIAPPLAGKVQTQIRLMVGNHFAVIISDSGTSAIQFLYTPLKQDGRLFLPLEMIVPVLEQWLAPSGVRAFLNEATMKLTLSFPPFVEAAAPVIVKNDSTSRIPEPEFALRSIHVDERTNGVIIRILAEKNLQYEFIQPDKNGIGYVTFIKATGNLDSLTKSFEGGYLKKIKPMKLKSGAVQLTLEFDYKKYKATSIQFQREPRTNNFILLALREANVGQIHQTEKEQAIQESLEQSREKWKLDVIALDAGHGGKDAGAIGKGGNYEKDVALSVILKVGKILAREWPEVKVIYTREEDKFIELDERGKIANNAKAKLFVSVHCNASINRNAEGVEVYLLGLHKTDAALAVAQRENSVIREEVDYATRYKEFTDENVIMIAMAQSGFQKQSQTLADYVNRMITARTAQNNRGVKQAGFMVLWTPSMPSILIETGYITNPKEEKFLISADGQEKIASAIFEALQKYRAEYESH